jgi:malate dehydrogenase (oxaloacetate-decarboxylating)
MEVAAARAVAASIPEEELAADYIVPSVFNRAVAPAVAAAVMEAAVASGVAQRVPSSMRSSLGSDDAARA